MNKTKLRWTVLTGLVAAICAIGSLIPLPGFIKSAALDSAPAFISVAFLPPLYSGIAGALGHLATGLTSGFPQGPFHILIAVEMFIIVYVFNILHKKGFQLLKWVFLIFANGVLTPLPFYFIISPAFYSGAVSALTLAAAVNAVVAMVVLPIVSRVYKKSKVSSI